MDGESDAIEVLTHDHRAIESLLEGWTRLSGSTEQLEQLRQLCAALWIHLCIEHDIFYPAFIEATDDVALAECVLGEHNDLMQLVIRTMRTETSISSPQLVQRLRSLFEQHVGDEECDGGVFCEASESDMDLIAVGQRLLQQRSQLETDPTAAITR